MSSTARKCGSHQPELMAVGLLKKLDTTTLLRAAAVMRHGSHISNHVDANTKCSQGTNRRLATRARAFDFDVEVLDALFQGSTTSHFGCYLSSKRSRLARTLETLTTGRSPRQSIALAIGDGDDRVIEGSVNVCNTVSNVLANFLANALCCVIGRSFCHSGFSTLYFFSDWAALRGPLRVRALVRVRWPRMGRPRR